MIGRVLRSQSNKQTLFSRLCEDQQLDDLTIESSFFHKCGFMLSVRWSWIGPHTAFSCFSTSPLLRNQPKTLRVVLVSVPPANCASPSGVKVDMACGEHLLDHCQSLKDIKQTAGKEAIQVSAAERFRTKSEESWLLSSVHVAAGRTAGAELCPGPALRDVSSDSPTCCLELKVNLSFHTGSFCFPSLKLTAETLDTQFNLLHFEGLLFCSSCDSRELKLKFFQTCLFCWATAVFMFLHV